MTKLSFVIVAVSLMWGLSLGGGVKAVTPKDVNVVNEPNVTVLNEDQRKQAGTQEDQIRHAEDWTLTETHLGPLELTEGLKISKALLEEKFPGVIVTQEFLQGDSPDFIYTKVTRKDGELLFTIRSWLEEGYFYSTNRKIPEEFQIDFLEVYSSMFYDEFGIRPDDKVKDILEFRGNDLDFGLGHIAEVYMGKGKIFYNIDMPTKVWLSGVLREKHLDEIKAMAIREDWRVMTISWPDPSWN